MASHLLRVQAIEVGNQSLSEVSQLCYKKCYTWDCLQPRRQTVPHQNPLWLLVSSSVSASQLTTSNNLSPSLQSCRRKSAGSISGPLWRPATKMKALWRPAEAAWPGTHWRPAAKAWAETHKRPAAKMNAETLLRPGLQPRSRHWTWHGTRTGHRPRRRHWTRYGNRPGFRLRSRLASRLASSPAYTKDCSAMTEAHGFISATSSHGVCC